MNIEPVQVQGEGKAIMGEHVSVISNTCLKCSTLPHFDWLHKKHVTKGQFVPVNFLHLILSAFNTSFTGHVHAISTPHNTWQVVVLLQILKLHMCL